MTGAPFVPGSDTSEEAAEAIAPHLSRLQQLLLADLRRYPNGLTDEQMQDGGSGTPLWRPSTQRPRRIELVARGLVKDSGQRRRTRSGRFAVVWVAT